MQPEGMQVGVKWAVTHTGSGLGKVPSENGHRSTQEPQHNTVTLLCIPYFIAPKQSLLSTPASNLPAHGH